MNCPCGTEKEYSQCCEPYHLEKSEAPTSEILMRSRYSAFAMKKIDYLEKTTHPQALDQFNRQSNEAWAREAEFTKLEILNSLDEGNKGRVEFKAYYNMGGESHIHHEKSQFRKQNGIWYFREGRQVAPPQPTSK